MACGKCGKYLQAGAGTERAAALDGHPVVVFTRHKWRPERGSRDRARSVRATAPNSNRDADFASFTLRVPPEKLSFARPDLDGS